MAELARTPLYDLHLSLGARMVPFAGYEMPVQYPMGVLAEHLHTRAQAGLFDVSHMGQLRITGDGVEAALEAILPTAITDHPLNKARYSLLLNESGGILDDLMLTRLSADLSPDPFASSEVEKRVRVRQTFLDFARNERVEGSLNLSDQPSASTCSASSSQRSSAASFSARAAAIASLSA